MSKISKNQEAILRFIQQSLLNKGYPPSVREIGEAIGLKSSSTVHGHLSRLEAAGYIRRDKDKPRAIEIIHPDYIPDSYSFNSTTYTETNVVPIPLTRQELVDIPILGKVAAGAPLLAEENIEDYLSLPLHFLPKSDSELFILKIKGDSMINIGFLDGDYVIVSRQNTARDHDIVVALIEDSATVKTYYKEKDHIRLQPENDDYEPIRVRDVVILGKVISLYRRFV
ncbi:transcriptional repressor LexA [Clostridiales bacterium COT073_COT-073]|nr:transcriptional repressor LexA [Clostridiales bacterium COT073_COT-073]